MAVGRTSGRGLHARAAVGACVLGCTLLAACHPLSSRSDEPLEPAGNVPDPAVPTDDVAGGASVATGSETGGTDGQQPANPTSVLTGAGGQSTPMFLDAAMPAPADVGPVSDAAAVPSPFLGEAVFEVTTKAVDDSRYAPRNIVAIWVEDASGKPVKVLAQLAGVMRRALTLYNQRVMPPTSLFGASPSLDPDTITAATQRTYGTITVTWDMTDTQGLPVPDGVYTIFVECADGRVPPAVTSVELEKGPQAISIEIEDTDAFGPIRLSYTPPDAG